LAPNFEILPLVQYAKSKFFNSSAYTISPTNTATNPISVDQPYASPAASCCSINGTHSMYLEVDTAAGFFAGVKNCTDSVHKISRAFLLRYESVQFLTPAKQMAAVSPYSSVWVCGCVYKIE
jgi:hypothetical protein